MDRNSSSDWLKLDSTAISFIENKEKNGQRSPEENGDESNYTYYSYDRTQSNTRKIKGESFAFDPNTLSEAGWKKLGLRVKTIQTIKNYLARGGRFKIPEDLQKVYGLHEDEYERLRPFVNILSPEGKSEGHSQFQERNATKEFTRKEFSPTRIIDINDADTAAFISLPGIGSKLAGRIVNFRDKLGGFYSISQLAEIYGLHDSTYQKIKPYLKLENNVIRKININTATADELKAHPYIKYAIANPLVAYRVEHGPFNKIEDILKVMVVTVEVFNKIAPYLDTN